MATTDKHDTVKVGTGRGQGAPGVPKSDVHRNAIAVAKIRHGLRTGKLAKEHKYIENQVNKFRRYLENAVLALRNEISFEESLVISTACGWEVKRMKTQYYLRHEGNTLRVLDRAALDEKEGKYAEHRNKNVALLELNARPEPVELKNYIVGKVANNGRGGVDGAFEPDTK